MGFWEGVGSFLGEAAGKIQEQNKLQKSFEEEYSSLNNAELKSELNRWKSKSNCTERNLRINAIMKILEKRGVIKRQ